MASLSNNNTYAHTVKTDVGTNEKQLFTSDLGRERTAGDVLVIKLDNDVVVSSCGGQIGHSAGSIFVVFTANLSFGRTFDGQ